MIAFSLSEIQSFKEHLKVALTLKGIFIINQLPYIAHICENKKKLDWHAYGAETNRSIFTFN